MAYLVNDRWFANREEKAEDESERIITLPAKLILADIRSTDFDCSCYPLNETIENGEKGKEWLPKLLRVFVEKLIKNPLRQVSVGQCIVNVTRTKSSLPPIPFGLGVEMNNVFGSKWLINELNSLDFSVSSDEVLRNKQSVTEHEETSDILRTYFPGSFTQWMADNADHNGMTIVGKGVMHAMGSCCATTSSENGSCHNLRQIKRQKRKLVNTITRNKGIPVIPYIYPVESGLSRLFLKPILQLQMPYILSPDIHLDLVWHAQHSLTRYTFRLGMTCSTFSHQIYISTWYGMLNILSPDIHFNLVWHAQHSLTRYTFQLGMTCSTFSHQIYIST